MWSWLEIAWPYAALGASVCLSVVASSHAILRKRDVRAVLAWFGIIWLVPVGGAALYGLLGINRIQRKAARLRGDTARYHLPPPVPPLRSADVREILPDSVEHLSELARAVGKVTTRPLLAGNRITPLLDGDEAYPAMLEAIDEAGSSVSLLSYIFDYDRVGVRFADPLARARDRGVEVRVLRGKLRRGAGAKCGRDRRRQEEASAPADHRKPHRSQSPLPAARRRRPAALTVPVARPAGLRDGAAAGGSVGRRNRPAPGCQPRGGGSWRSSG